MATLNLSFTAIGTKWQIVSEIELPDERHEAVARAIHARIEQFDKDYSRFRSDSLVTKMSQAVGTYELPPDGYDLLRFYERLYDVSDGKVTPLIGQVIADLGYDANYSFQVGPATSPPAWHDVIDYSRQQISVKQPALLDFGAAGKGYLVDIIGALLNDADITDYMINAGGDIAYKTSAGTPLSVGLENPFDHSEVVAVIELVNQSICASSGSRRKWHTYSHIIDPDKLVSPTDVQATWVAADTALLADGLATALFFTEPAKLRAEFAFSYAILRADMSLEYSGNFPLVRDGAFA